MIKIKFVDFGFDGIADITKEILKNNKIEYIESDNPDFLFYSVFGDEHYKYDCVRIEWIGENIRPDFNVCDYAIGFDYMEYGDRYIRIPLYYFYRSDYMKLFAPKEKGLSDSQLLDRKFCNFIYSNGNAASERKLFFEMLSKYKSVDSGGKYLNNINRSISDKLNFQRQYKFSIAFENSSYPGYTTEKILHAFVTRTIPIYWGNPLVNKEFNSNAFINCNDYDSFDDVIRQIKLIDENDEIYLDYLHQSPFADNELFPENPLTEYEKFILNIVSQSPQKAIRRSHSCWEHSHELDLRKKSFIESHRLLRFGLNKMIVRK